MIGGNMRTSRILGIAMVVVATGLPAGGVASVAEAASVAQAATAVAPIGVAPAAEVAAGVHAVIAPAAAAPRAGAAPAIAAQRAAAPAKAAASAAGVPCTSTVRACIDLTHNKAWLLRDGVVEYGPAPITSGRKGYRTPVGTFHVRSRERLHLSRAFDNAPMPYSVFFIPGIAFHQGSLGVPSHGCIHLSKAAAITFYNTLRVGDVVQAVR
jgi:lipoprotein-anchoring transpeptidase ErfK/SrfK